MDITQTRALFDSPAFAAAYHTDLPLGSFCAEDGTLFRLWAPTAENVILRLYPTGDRSAPLEILHPQREEKGLWTCRTGQNLDGVYYDYAVTVDGVLYETNDPWARACGINGRRSMVLDLCRTDPPGWSQDRPPSPEPEQIIWETHIRDFSWDPAGGFSPEDRGRYRALTRLGTTLNGDGIHPTGLGYLKDLGVTHIQLLPIYDYGSVDESDPEASYNWGYDPVNYNVPEGSYSSDPTRGEVRIRELKEMIAALHKNGFRVIMDVVYNHTYRLESNLFKTVPWYFYRQNDLGAPSNGSGCGNDIATERSMATRYILESALYWVEEYHLDGFRLDLMGLMDRELITRLRTALDEKYGPGEKLLYGEPWRAGTTHPRPGATLCDKEALTSLPMTVGAFCDQTRDAVKGSVMEEASRGFVNGGVLTPELLRSCITGWPAPRGPFRSPRQVISYLSCHDDWTLWDKLVHTLDPEKRFSDSPAELLGINRLAAAFCFCCQGRPFLLSGEEFGRTKEGIKNSYCSESRINRLDWTRAWKNRSLVDWYRGLIALRKQLPAFTDKTPQAKNRLLWTRTLGPNCVAACLDNRPRDGADTSWPTVLAVFNCSDASCAFPLPRGIWQLLWDRDSSFRWQNPVFSPKTVVIPPGSPLLLAQFLPPSHT